MAKNTASPEAQLLAALRNALAGPMLLYATKSEPGIFPSGKAGKELAERAKQEEYIEEFRETLPPTGKSKKGKEVVKARLTTKGRDRVLEAFSPRKLLEDLVPIIRDLSARLASDGSQEGGAAEHTATVHAVQEAVRKELDQSTANRVLKEIEKESGKLQQQLQGLQEKINTAFEKVTESVRKAVEQGTGAVDQLPQVVERVLRDSGPKPNERALTADRLAGVLSAVEAATERVKANEVPAPAPHPEHAPHPHHPPTHEHQEPKHEANWLEEVPRMAAEQKERNHFKQLSLPEVYRHLKERHPHLTVGQFHEGLRRLYEERRIALLPFTQALAEIDDPQNALFLDREVKYYVDLP